MLFNQNMTVYGYEISNDLIEEAVVALREKEFVAKQLETLLVTAGVPHFGGNNGKSGFVANRATDRTIKKLKNTGMITFTSDRTWQWQK